MERTRKAGGRGGWQSYCNWCHALYVRQRRAGKVEVLLTPEEWARVQADRDFRSVLEELR